LKTALTIAGSDSSGGGVGPTHHFFDLYARAGFDTD
jgi:hypothetical protein